VLGAFDRDPEGVCSDTVSRELYISLLRSLGAKQMGGRLGQSLEAFAWVFAETQTRPQIIAFTIPFSPSRLTGINFASFPLLIRDLLSSQGVLATGSEGQKGWPRPAEAMALPAAERRNVNVPAGESGLQEMSQADLPPGMIPNQSANLENGKLDSETQDAWLFVKLFATLIFAVSFFEIISSFATSGSFMNRLRQFKFFALFTVFVSSLYSESLQAQISLNLLGNFSNEISFRRLVSEVQSRTSVELRERPLKATDADTTAFGEPWMWVSDPNVLMRLMKDQSKKLALKRWIEKGGFLIVENYQSAGFKKVSSQKQESAADNAGLAAIEELWSHERVKGKWNHIPLDHELMRSFYLVDGLPTCQGRAWMSLQYDQRLAVLAIPTSLIRFLSDQGAWDAPIESTKQRSLAGCETSLDKERASRLFVNILMVSLTTDYKKDQVHLPEILKRLR